MLLLPILLYVIFASMFPVIKLALQYSPPFFLTGIWMAFAGCILTAYQYLFNKKAFKSIKKHILLIFFLAVFNIYLTNSFELWGLQYLSSAKTSFLFNFSPLFSAFFSYLFLREKVTLKKMIYLVIGFLGFIPMLLDQLPAEANIQAFFIFSWAELALILSAFSTALGWIIMRKLVSQNYNMVLANGLSMLLGSLFCFLNSLYTENWYDYKKLILNSKFFFLYIIILIIFSNLIAYNLYGYLLKKYTATFMTLMGFISPFFAAFFGWLFLGEKVSINLLISSTIVFFSIYLFYKEELKQEYKAV